MVASLHYALWHTSKLLQTVHAAKCRPPRCLQARRARSTPSSRWAVLLHSAKAGSRCFDETTLAFNSQWSRDSILHILLLIISCAGWRGATTVAAAAANTPEAQPCAYPYAPLSVRMVGLACRCTP